MCDDRKSNPDFECVVPKDRQLFFRMPLLSAILTVLVIFTALPRGTVGYAMIVSPGVTVTFTCTGPGDQSAVEPTWFVNGKFAVTDGGCYRSILRTAEGLIYTATLMITGNRTCDTFNVYCRITRDSESQFLYLHNTTLIFEGRLPSPENVHINVNSSTIDWNPPYSSVNNKSDVINVDPHITHYTVYITDNYTGNIIVKENVTETHFSFKTSDNSCPVYQVSAGDEGELSAPLWDSTPQVPHRVTAENITVAYTVKPNVLHIHLNVDVVCTNRTPEFFLITVMNSAGNVLKESNMSHDPGQEVANFNISLPQSIDICSLHVKISPGNSAGMSASTEAGQVDCSDTSTNSTPTSSTESGPHGEDLTAVIVGAVAGGLMIILLTVGILYMIYRKHRKRNSKGQRDNSYSKSPSLGGPVPLYKPSVTEVVCVTSKQTTSRAVARDPEVPSDLQPSDSAPSTLRTGSSTESGHSGDLLLPPSHPAPARSPQLMYAQLNVKQTQVQPPANDDHVQYAQIEHHES